MRIQSGSEDREGDAAMERARERAEGAFRADRPRGTEDRAGPIFRFDRTRLPKRKTRG